MTVPNSARLPAGLLLAAALMTWAPLFANPPTFAALAVGAWMATAFRLRGLLGAAAIVIGAVAFVSVTGWQSPGINQVTDDIQTRTDQVAEVVDQVETVIEDIEAPSIDLPDRPQRPEPAAEGVSPVAGAEAETEGQP